MASKYLHEAKRGASRGSIDLPVAIVAGLSIGFVGFMLPGDIFSRLVEMSRLPDLFPPASPPLGTKAQAAFAVGAAGAAALAVYVLLRLLGRKSAEPKAQVWPDVDTEREPETPRLRRSDIHPDAPARRPILAARELGEPDASTAFVPAPQGEPVVPDTASDFPNEPPLELGGPGTELLEPEPEAATVPEPVLEQPAVRQEEVAQPVGDASIADLMARLERGLARRAGRKAAPLVAPAETVAPAAPTHEDRGDDRLRSAIENLQKMAARAG